MLIANTNDNYRNIDGVERRIPQSGSPTEHGATIWEKYVMGSNPEAVSIVAHSYGGVVTLFLVKLEAFYTFVDIHSIVLFNICRPRNIRNFLATRCSPLVSQILFIQCPECPMGFANIFEM